jgi:hypothetical protein
MVRQDLPHEHRSLHFRVEETSGRSAKYSPAIVARRGTVLFLVEPIPTAGRPTIDRLRRFLEQHSPEIVLVVVAPDSKVLKIPAEAYDEIYAESALPRMTQRIREQDPEGIVRPFEKPRPAG